MDFKNETGLSTREIVNKLYYEFGYIIYPRKLNSVLRGNTKPDEKLEESLKTIYEQTRRARNSVTNYD